MAMPLEPMTPLDKRCILALKPVRGMSFNAKRIADRLATDLGRGRSISVRQRHALYAICWRYRRQLAVELQVKVAIAAADAHMMALLVAVDAPGQSRIRAARLDLQAASTPGRRAFDDLFAGAGT